MNKNWFVHIEWAVVLITLLGGFYMLDGKIERQVCFLDEKLERQAARTDRLYEMFIDLVRSK